MATVDPIGPDLERRRADRTRQQSRQPVGNFVDRRRLGEPTVVKLQRVPTTPVPTKYEERGRRISEELVAQEQRERELRERQDAAARRLLQDRIALVDFDRPNAPYAPDEEIPSEYSEESDQEQPGEPGVSERLRDEATGRATDAIAGRLRQRGAQALESGAGKAAQAGASRAAAAGAARTAASGASKALAFLGPYGEAAALAIQLYQNRKTIIKAQRKIIAGIIALVLLAIVFVGLIFALIVYATSSDPQLQGSSAVQPISTGNFAQQSQIQRILNGSTISTADAQTFKTEIEALSGRASGNAEATTKLNEMRAAVQAIIDNNGRDPAVTSSQMTILKKSYAEFTTLVGSSDNCNGAPTCLPVPPVGQSGPFRCQQASTISVIMYYTGINSTFAQEHVQRDSAGNFYDKASGSECFFDTSALNREAGSVGRGDWIHFNYKSYGINDVAAKTKLFDAIIKSLQSGDPVVAYFEGGGIQGPRHIVPIVGYNAIEEAGQGGTFYVHHPFPPQPNGKRYYAFIGGIRRTKFTKNHFMQHIGGDGTDGWTKSVLIRRVYTQS